MTLKVSSLTSLCCSESLIYAGAEVGSTTFFPNFSTIQYGKNDDPDIIQLVIEVGSISLVSSNADQEKVEDSLNDDKAQVERDVGKYLDEIGSWWKESILAIGWLGNEVILCKNVNNNGDSNDKDSDDKDSDDKDSNDKDSDNKDSDNKDSDDEDSDNDDDEKGRINVYGFQTLYDGWIHITDPRFQEALDSLLEVKYVMLMHNSIDVIVC